MHFKNNGGNISSCTGECSKKKKIRRVFQKNVKCLWGSNFKKMSDISRVFEPLKPSAFAPGLLP